MWNNSNKDLFILLVFNFFLLNERFIVTTHGHNRRYRGNNVIKSHFELAIYFGAGGCRGRIKFTLPKKTRVDIHLLWGLLRLVYFGA